LLAEIDALGWPSERPPDHDYPHCRRAISRPRRRAIGEFWSCRQSRTFAELLIDREEDRTLQVVLVSMLRQRQLGV
jgi:hypothetical protein